MTDERRESQGLLEVLLAPLRAPQRVAADVERIASGVLVLQRNAAERLASIDERAGALLRSVGGLRAPVERIDRRVTELEKLEAAVTLRLDAIRSDLNARMLAVEEEVRGMRPAIEQMSRDLSNVVELLPKASDGPLARLKDTLTSS